VGNTKVLTEHDNLFELSNQYIYKNGSIIITGVTQDAPIQRTLQERLDDIVNVRSFGAQGVGGSTDDTVELQRAIDQLFTGDGTTDIFTEQRVTLYIPAGTYKISSSLKLPPYSTLIGDGSEHTVIEQTANFPVLETVNGSRTTTSVGNQATTSNNIQAKHILIKGLTLKSFNDNSALKVNSCSHSTFEDIKLVGNYDYVTPANTPYTNNYGIHLTTVNPSDSTVITCEDNLFKNIKNPFSLMISCKVSDTVVVTPTVVTRLGIGIPKKNFLKIQNIFTNNKNNDMILLKKEITLSI
jgi:hypothetical protein